MYFLNDLNQAYTTSQLTNDNDTILFVILIVSNSNSIFFLFAFSDHHFFLFTYLDAVIEHEMPMTGASMFWLDTLHDCHLDRSLPLPYDRHRRVG